MKSYLIKIEDELELKLKELQESRKTLTRPVIPITELFREALMLLYKKEKEKINE